MTPKPLFFYPTRCFVGSLATALSLTVVACSAPSTGDAGDLGAPDGGLDLGPLDAGDGLTTADRDFLDALARAECMSLLCEPEGVLALHGDVDACLRAFREGLLGTLPGSVGSGAVSLDLGMADACLAQVASCTSTAAPACSAIFVRAHPLPVGAPCAVAAECAVGDTCGGSSSLSGVCPETLRCLHTVALGGACTAGDYCAQDGGALASCYMGTCTRTRRAEVGDGDLCNGVWLPPDPDGTAVQGWCPADLACVAVADVYRCGARPTAGASCQPHECVRPLSCLGGVCGSPTYLGLGAGCETPESSMCDASLGLFCDGTTHTCVMAGDGSLGSTCDDQGLSGGAGNLFPCVGPLLCNAGRCVEAMQLGTACTATSPCVCSDSVDGTCIACP